MPRVPAYPLGARILLSSRRTGAGLRLGARSVCPAKRRQRAGPVIAGRSGVMSARRGRHASARPTLAGRSGVMSARRDRHASARPTLAGRSGVTSARRGRHASARPVLAVGCRADKTSGSREDRALRGERAAGLSLDTGHVSAGRSDHRYPRQQCRRGLRRVNDDRRLVNGRRTPGPKRSRRPRTPGKAGLRAPPGTSTRSGRRRVPLLPATATALTPSRLLWHCCRGYRGRLAAP